MELLVEPAQRRLDGLDWLGVRGQRRRTAGPRAAWNKSQLEWLHQEPFRL